MKQFLNTFATDYPDMWQTSKILTIILLCGILYFIAKYILHKLVAGIIKKTKTDFDDLILKSPVYPKLALIPSIILLYQFSHIFLGASELINRLVFTTLTLLIILAINSVFNIIQQVSARRKETVRANIKSYLQISKIIVWILGVVVIISIMIGKSPLILLSGLGALSAVLILVFRDTILSFVAGMQISSYDLIKVGDWIEAPKFGADGDVIDISLHTVMVQNWDRTITVIPTYKLVEDSFKNWRGMSISGGRRIKRAVYIDMSTVKFCNPEMLERFRKFQLITYYIESRQNEIKEYNITHNVTLPN